MINWFKDALGIARKRAHDEEKEARRALLESVEAEAKDLRERADMATYTIIHRGRRNHWQESVYEMILGVRR